MTLRWKTSWANTSRRPKSGRREESEWQENVSWCQGPLEVSDSAVLHQSWDIVRRVRTNLLQRSRAVKFSYILTLFVLITQCQVSCFMTTYNEEISTALQRRHTQFTYPPRVYPHGQPPPQPFHDWIFPMGTVLINLMSSSCKWVCEFWWEIIPGSLNLIVCLATTGNRQICVYNDWKCNMIVQRT